MMKSKLIILTIGTSIFTNLISYIQGNNRDKDKLKSLNKILENYKQQLGTKGFISGIKLSGHLEKNKHEINDNIKTQIIREISELLIHNGENFAGDMSAEINSFNKYKNLKKSWGVGEITFDLFYTDTLIGELCGKILEEYLSKQEKAGTCLTLIENFSADAFSMKNEGLINFVLKLFEKLNYYREKNYDIEIIGTGGYKAQIPYTLLSALFYRIPVYYHHQLFNDLISLPRIPILFLDTRVISKNENLIRRIKNEKVSYNELKKDWNKEIEKEYMKILFEKEIQDDQEVYCLSKIGEILLFSYDNPKEEESKLNIRELDEVKDDYFFKGRLIEIKEEKNDVYLLFTTGTSLLTQAINYYRNNRDKLSEDRPLSRILTAYIEELRNNPGKFIPIQAFVLKYIDNWNITIKSNMKRFIIQDIKKFLQISLKNGKLSETSAELNTLDKMIEEGYVHEGRIQGLFLVSDTYTGALCGEALADFCNTNYCSGNKSFSSITIKDLSYDFQKFKSKGMKNLIKIITTKILKANMPTAVCATGGFKAETAYATMLGMILCKPIFYIHENHRNLIYFPPFPIILNYSRIVRYFDHFFNLDQGVNEKQYKEFSKIWEENNDKENMEIFINILDTRYNLNEAGQIIYEILKNNSKLKKIQEKISTFLKNLIESDDYLSEDLNKFDWNKTGGSLPEPAKKQGLNPLIEFLKPLLNKTYVKSIKYQEGGMGTSPNHVNHYSTSKWPKYLPNSGGGSIEISYPNIKRPLRMTVFFNNTIKNCQDILEKSLTNITRDILNSQLQIDPPRNDIRIKLPPNYLNNRLINEFIDYINAIN